jgi:hypothetical protein
MSAATAGKVIAGRAIAVITAPHLPDRHCLRRPPRATPPRIASESLGDSANMAHRDRRASDE